MDLEKFNSEVDEIADIIISAYNKPIDSYDDVEKQIVPAYVFGCVNTYALEFENGGVKEVRDAMLHILKDKFMYSNEYAAEMFGFLVNCTDPEFHSTVNAVIHRGIDAYGMLNDEPAIKADLDQIMAVIYKWMTQASEN